MNERSSNGAGSSLINSILRLRSRILWKYDLEIEEICCANCRFVSKMTPRSGAESTGESMTLLGRWMVALLSLESCCGRPKMRNSVLEGLSDRKLDDIRLATLVIVFSRWVIRLHYVNSFLTCISSLKSNVDTRSEKKIEGGRAKLTRWSVSM